MHVRARTSLTALVAALMLAFITACGGAGEASDAQGQRLEEAEFIDNPKDYEGPSTAKLADSSIRPIANNPSPELPATVTDNQGTTTTVTDASRILAIDLYGTSARTVFELGLGENVVGRDISTGFEEAADLPLVTENGHDLNAEAILELAPSVIITDSSLGPWDVVLQMRDAGIPVIVIDSFRDTTNVGDITMQIAEALGIPEEGEKLTKRIESDIAEIEEQIAQHIPQDEDDKLRMMFLYVRGQAGVYYIFGPGSGTDSLITGVGGIDVASDIGWDGMMPMTDEAIVEAQPDLVMMMTKGLESVQGVDGLLEHVPALAHTPAGEKRRIVDMSDYEVLSFGPNTTGVLEALALAIYAPEDSQDAAANDEGQDAE